MRQRLHLIFLMMAAAAAQAQSPVQPAILTSLTLTPSLALVGRTTPVQMHAVATFGNGQMTDVSSSVNWSSASGQSVISASGLLTAVGNGSDTITATYGQIGFGGMTASATAATVVDTNRQTVTATLPVGQSPVGAAVNPLTNKIYIANSGSNNVTVIDGYTNTTTTIAAGASPSAIAVNPVTNRIYVANKGANSVTVIDGAAGTTTTVSACSGTGPATLAVNPVSNQIFVGCNNGVTVINGSNNQTTLISFGTLVTALAVNPATNMVYAATFAKSIEVIDGTTQSVITSIPVNSESPVNLLAVDPARNRIYGGSSQLAFFYVIDGNTNQVIIPTNPQAAPVGGAIAVNPNTGQVATALKSVTTYNPSTNSYAPTQSANPGAGAAWVAAALNPVTGDAYVISTEGNIIGVLNGANGYLLTSTLTAGLSPVALTINPATNKIYVVNQGSNSVTVVDGASNQITALTANLPTDVQVNPETNQAYIVNGGNNTVSVVDGATNNITAVPVGTNPLAAAVNPVTNKIYVANNGSNNVTVIDGASNMTTTLPAGKNPFGIVANPVTDQVYVANSDGTLTIIAGATGTTTSLNEGITAGNGSSAPYGMALDVATNKLYMPNAANGMLAVIDGTAGTVSTLAAGVKPSAVAVDSFTNQIYVADLGGQSVVAIDGTTLHETTIPLTFEPWSIEVNRVTGLVYVGGLSVSTNLDALAVINPTVSPATVLTLSGSTAAAPATALAVDEVTNRIYFAGPGISLTGLDGETNALTFQSDPPLNVGAQGHPNAIAINPVTHQVYGVSSILSPASFFVAEEPVESSPLSVSVASLPGNLTSNPTPSFVLTAVDGLDPGLPANQNVNVYFRFDARDGAWSTAVLNQNGTFGVTPATPLQPGMHVLLAFATNGREATMSGSGDGFGNGDGPVIGQMLAYVFFVQPAASSGGSNGPVITSVQTTNISGTSATVTWTTDQESSSTVNYGTTTGYGSTAGSSTLTMSHSVTLTGLTGSTTYDFDVVSANSSGTPTTSGNNTFTTGAGPSTESLTPASGTSLSQAFTAVYSDSLGAADLQTVYLLFNTSTNVANACYVQYSRATNSLYLTNDAGNGLSTAVTPGSAGTVFNSQCTLSGAGSSVTASGNNLSVTYAITFTSGFSGTQNAYLHETGSGGSSGWSQGGTWTAGGGTAGGFWLTPASGTGLTQTFTAVYSDPLGPTDLEYVYLLLAPSATDVAHSCLVQYFPGANTMGLYVDAGTGPEGPVTPGSTGTVSNSQCSLSGAGSAVTTTSNTLTVTFAITFSSSYAGTQNSYLAVTPQGAHAGPSFNQKGTWTVPNAPAPAITSVQTTNISSTSVTVTWTTDQASSSTVNYGATMAYGSTAGSAALTTSHSVTLTGLTAGTTYDFQAVSANSASVSATSVNYTFVTLSSTVASSATYLTLDSTTQGTWTGVYGADGYIIANDANSAPSYASVSFTGQSAWTWANGTSDPRALQTASGSSSRIASTYYGSSSFSINVNLNDGNAHKVALYLLDWDGGSRAETISILDASTHSVLSSQSFSGFQNGKYASWSIKGNVIIQVTLTGGENPAVAAIFFGGSMGVAAPVISGVAASSITITSAVIMWTTDQASSSQVSYGTTTAYTSSGLNSSLVTAHSVTLSGLTPGTNYDYEVISANSANVSSTAGNFTFATAGSSGGSSSASYIGLDTATQGTWTGVYGGDGFIIANGANNAPSYGSVTFTGQSTWTWITPTSDPRALQIASGSLTRIASTYYGGSSFAINLNLTDGNSHKIALYLLDWDAGSRAETIAILDASTHSVLNTQAFSGFQNGQFASWNIKGNVIIQVTLTGGENPVVAGIFFGGSTAGTAAPVISGVTASSITGTSAVITWMTDEAASSLVDYGTTASYGSASLLNSALVMSHSVTLSGLTPGVTYDYDVVSANAGSLSSTSTNFTFSTPSGSTTSSAAYQGLDTTTQGTWTGHYGTNGYLIANDGNNLPSFAPTSLTGDAVWTFASITNDPRAPQISSGSSQRIAAVFYSTGSSFNINANLTDGKSHRIALYLLDWDTTTRAETITIMDAASHAVLDTEAFASFQNGKYAIWSITGSVVIQVTDTAGINAVVSGIFVD